MWGIPPCLAVRVSVFPFPTLAWYILKTFSLPSERPLLHTMYLSFIFYGTALEDYILPLRGVDGPLLFSVISDSVTILIWYWY